MTRPTAALERDRVLVQAMRLLGEPDEVIDDFLACLDLDEGERDELRRAGPPDIADDIATGDVLEMNPLTSQPQRSTPRS